MMELMGLRPGNSQIKLQPNGFQTPGSGGGGNPQYPGQKQGLTYEQSQAWINNSKKSRGFIFSAVAATINRYDIPISGVAKCMMGLALHAIDTFDDDPSMPDGVSLLINNETLIQDHPFVMLDIKYMDFEYFQFIRPLVGNDDITLIVNNAGATTQNIAAVFYYI